MLYSHSNWIGILSQEISQEILGIVLIKSPNVTVAIRVGGKWKFGVGMWN